MTEAEQFGGTKLYNLISSTKKLSKHRVWCINPASTGVNVQMPDATVLQLGGPHAYTSAGNPNSKRQSKPDLRRFFENDSFFTRAFRADSVSSSSKKVTLAQVSRWQWISKNGCDAMHRYSPPK